MPYLQGMMIPRPSPLLILLAAALALGPGAAASAQVPATPDTLFSDLDGIDYAAFETPAVMADSAAVRYPLPAIFSSMSGEVIVDVAVAADGRPVRAAVRRLTNVLLDREATTAAMHSRYRPARSHGESVPGRAEIRYKFDAAQALTALGARPDPQPYEWTGPMVATIADSTWTWHDGRPAVRLHDGTIVIGEISVAGLDTILADVRPRLGPGEILDSIRVTEPEKLRDGMTRGRAGEIHVMTCTEKRTAELCLSGYYYLYDRRFGRFTFRDRVRFWI